MGVQSPSTLPTLWLQEWITCVGSSLTIQSELILTERLAEEPLQGSHHFDGFCSYLGLQWLFRQSEVGEVLNLGKHIQKPIRP